MYLLIKDCLGELDTGILQGSCGCWLMVRTQASWSSAALTGNHSWWLTERGSWSPSSIRVSCMIHESGYTYIMWINMDIRRDSNISTQTLMGLYMVHADNAQWTRYSHVSLQIKDCLEECETEVLQGSYRAADDLFQSHFMMRGPQFNGHSPAAIEFFTLTLCPGL